MSDGELLRAYSMEGSEAAFASLVNRYLPLVHSVAGRHLPDRALSEEVTQAVFVLLAKKARELTGHPSIAGWLHRTAWQLAARTARAEVRRRRRESEAAFNSPSIMSPPDPPEAAPVLPAMDAALQDLPDDDRDILVLRYFLRKPIREVGATLGVSEAAAKMRIRRALNQLKILLVRRGITCSPAALAAVMTHNGVTKVPDSLAARVIPAAANAGASSTNDFLLLHGIYSFMNGTKLAVLVTSAVLIAGLSAIAIRNGKFDRTTIADLDPSRAMAVGVESPVHRSNHEPDLPRAKLTENPTALELDGARRRLMVALAAPLPKSGPITLGESVTDAMAAFGGRQAELFAALQAAFLDQSFSFSEQRAVRTRALLAMRQLDKSLPGLTSFLWDTVRNDNINRPGALFTLRKLGLESADIPALMGLLDSMSIEKQDVLWSPVPDTIRDVLVRNPEAAAANLPGLLEQLGRASDPSLRFSIASALLGIPGADDPRIMDAIRGGLRTGLQLPATEGGDSVVVMAIELAAKSGESAKPLIPDLLYLAKTSDVPYQRNAAWLAIGKIQPELIVSIPELDQAIKSDSEIRRIRQDFAQGIATPDDLVRALHDPAIQLEAAQTLAETGISSPEVINELMTALQGMSEDRRDLVVAAIQKMDPLAAIERVPADVVFDGVISARSAATSPKSTSNNPRLERLLSELGESTWRTPEEVLAATRNLAALDIAAAQAFVKGLSNRDPKLADRALQQIAVRGNP
ncbi:MAG: sigma-70 family RNA polymerase sigma factor [Verrucomicrobiota bacterium]